MKYQISIAFFSLICISSFSQSQKIIIHFPFDSYSIITSEAKLLDSFIQAVPKTALMISGHTDSKGTDLYNRKLSEQRAAAVKNYLIAHSYPAEYIKEDFFGESKLIEPDNEDELKGLINRRVEIVWLAAKPSADIEKAVTEVRSIKELIEDTATIAGSKLVLQNLNFMGGRHRILPVSLPQLRSLLSAMQDNPKLTVSIEGHICCMNGLADGLDFDTNTEDLSFQRAKAISEYLIYMGIDKRRIQFRGYGHSAPLFPFPEKSEAEQVANRRVEVRILTK